MDIDEDVLSEETLASGGEVPKDQELSNQEKKDDDGGSLDKQLNDTKRRLHEVTQERARERREMAERLARLEGQLSMLNRPTDVERPAENPLAFLDEESFKEGFFEDAAHPIQAMKKLAGVFGEALSLRDKYWKDELDKVRSAANRPDPSVAKRLEELRKDPDLADLDDKALLVLDKKMSGSKREYPGGNETKSRAVRGSATEAELEKAVKNLMAKAGYED